MSGAFNEISLPCRFPELSSTREFGNTYWDRNLVSFLPSEKIFVSLHLLIFLPPRAAHMY